MFACWALLALPWLWFYFGLMSGMFYVVVCTLSALVYRRYTLSSGLFVVGLVVLLQLEWSATHILRNDQQHQDAFMVICINEPVKEYADYFSGLGLVMEQPIEYNLRQVRLTGSTELVKGLQPGDCINGQFRLRQPFGRLVPGEFDPDRYFFSQSIDAKAQLRALVAVEHDPLPAAALYHRASPHFTSSQQLELWSALVLGWSSALDRDTKELLAATQLSHLFVISGFHIAVVAVIAHGLISLLSWGLSPWFTLPLWGRFGGVGILCLLYVGFLGFPVPAVRALIMLLVPFLMISGRLQVSTYSGLTAAMMIVLLLYPEQWLGIGSWLSFIAVLAILAAYRWGLLPSRKIAGALMFQSLMTAMTVFFAFLFNMRLSWVGFFTNLIAGPVVAFFLFPLALLTAAWPGCFAGLFESSTRVAWSALSSLSAYSTSISGFDVAVVLFFTIALTASLWLPKPFKRLATFSFLAVFIASVGVQHLLTESQQRTISRLTLFDVGHGLAALIEHQGIRVLYDTGGRLTDGTSVYEAFLAEAIGEPNVLIVSHGDSDHSAGALDITHRYPSMTVFSGAAQSELPAENCHAQTRVNDHMHFIAVPEGLKTNSNNHSCLLVVNMNGYRWMLTGDADKKIEYWLLQAYPELFPLDMVVLGHHGSGHSSVGQWLEENESAVFLNSGADYFRPRWPDERIERWFSLKGYPLVNTALEGSIRVDFQEQDLVIKTGSSALRKRLIN